MLINSRHARAKRRRWRSWLERIYRDVIYLAHSKRIYAGLGEIVRANRKIQIPSDFHDWASRNYGISTALAIRRLTDDRSDSVSLVRLLSEMARSPEVLSRASYV